MALLLVLGCGSDVTVQGRGVTASDIEATLDQLDVVLCNCRHGCGPGMDGELRFTLTNVGEQPIMPRVDGVHWLRPGSDAPTYSDLAWGHPFNNAPPDGLAPGASETFDFPLQLDVASFEEGVFDVSVTLVVDGVRIDKPLATQELSFVANDDCDG